MPVVKTHGVFSGISVGKAMRQQVVSLPRLADIGQGIRMMIRNKVNAVLITDNGVPCGVGSKTDLILAYHHGVSPETEARAIMNTPVHSIAADELLSAAIQQMLVRDVQRLFVYRDASNPDRIAGVLALSDSARFRSGSCRACAAGRILIR